MATIKSYTDLSQSKKLAEILPIESANMHSEAIDIDGSMVFIVVGGLGDKTKSNYGSPIWSLSALLGALPDYTLKSNEFYGKVALWCQGISVEYDNPVDACVAMVEKLNELKVL